MADINTGVALTFENDGRLIIGTGGGAKNVLNIKHSTLKETGGGRAPIKWQDRGVNKKPLRGNERECQIEGTIFYTGTVGVGGLLDLLRGELDDDDLLANYTDTGEIFTFTLTVEQPDAPGSTSGQRRVYEECYLENPHDISAAGNGELDGVNLRIMSVGASPAWTRYAPEP